MESSKAAEPASYKYGNVVKDPSSGFSAFGTRGVVEDSRKTSMKLIRETEATAWVLGCEDDKILTMRKDNLGKIKIC
ncbi:hypothetical protein AVEN_268118-1 [Araneus ventricosus]|uniref:Uncharacterized protein n=1 Tax=Araneus ventricosus TaxID=182803 RepID=A0A4Y2RFR1_ARAVE|nr:hypothetical protein AVEN_268118-1 [Araneus ventricosus]